MYIIARIILINRNVYTAVPMALVLQGFVDAEGQGCPHQQQEGGDPQQQPGCILHSKQNN